MPDAFVGLEGTHSRHGASAQLLAADVKRNFLELREER